jgi:hypothetical protein
VGPSLLLRRALDCSPFNLYPADHGSTERPRRVPIKRLKPVECERLDYEPTADGLLSMSTRSCLKIDRVAEIGNVPSGVPAARCCLGGPAASSPCAMKSWRSMEISLPFKSEGERERGLGSIRGGNETMGCEFPVGSSVCVAAQR